MSNVTICLAYRVPGEGAVLACDGRIVDAATNAIISDADKKYVVCGPTVVMIAGTFGKLFHKIAASPPKSFSGVRSAIDEHMDDDTEWLAYDKRTDRLYLDDIVLGRPIAGIGAGSPFGLGALEALPLARSLEAAYKAVSIAMSIACRRNASCGGRVRLLTAPKRGPIKYGPPHAAKSREPG